MDEMQRELGCSADEETYALLAAGWAQVGLGKSHVLTWQQSAHYQIYNTNFHKVDLGEFLPDWPHSNRC